MTVERPHTPHDGRERRRRRRFGVFHGDRDTNIAGRICSSPRCASPHTVPSPFDLAQGRPARASIAQVAWIAGLWTGKDGGMSFEERWTPPAGAMLAVSRTLKGDRMVAFEFLRIVERDGGLVYVAQPNGRPPTDFVLTELTADSATFENPAHDFPKMIRYARRGAGTLEARISDGGQRAETFVFHRTP
ncbi:MAG TPA: DUF6265 family protein [Vicinamibacterales bacterium]|nr:DUF6265 family protein [Vicinamibacterales bacterium]